MENTFKVKSHRSLSALKKDYEDGNIPWVEYFWSLGNDQADRVANAARELHGYSQEEIDTIKAHRAHARRVTWVMASMLAEWPTAREMWGDIKSLPKLPRHSERVLHTELVVEIPTNAPERVKDADWGHGHEIAVLEDVDKNVVAVCKRCGCRAAQKVRGLKKQCGGKPASHHTRNVLRKMQDGKHPTTNLPLVRREKLLRAQLV